MFMFHMFTVMEACCSCLWLGTDIEILNFSNFNLCLKYQSRKWCWRLALALYMCTASDIDMNAESKAQELELAKCRAHRCVWLVLSLVSAWFGNLKVATASQQRTRCQLTSWTLEPLGKAPNTWQFEALSMWQPCHSDN